MPMYFPIHKRVMEVSIHIPKDIILNILSFSDIFVILNVAMISKDIHALISKKYPDVPRLMRTKPVRPIFDLMKPIRNGKLVHIAVIAYNNRCDEIFKLISSRAPLSVGVAISYHSMVVPGNKSGIFYRPHIDFLRSILSDDNIEDPSLCNQHIIDIAQYAF